MTAGARRRVADTAAVLGVLLSLAASPPPLRADDSTVARITGEWWTPGFRARAQVGPCGQAVCATLRWVWDPRTAAPGLVVLSGLRADGRGGWTGGRAINPEDGQSYSASLRIIDRDHLLVAGCLAFLCREQVWVRVGAPPVTPYDRP